MYIYIYIYIFHVYRTTQTNNPNRRRYHEASYPQKKRTVYHYRMASFAASVYAIFAAHVTTHVPASRLEQYHVAKIASPRLRTRQDDPALVSFLLECIRTFNRVGVASSAELCLQGLEAHTQRLFQQNTREFHPLFPFPPTLCPAPTTETKNAKEFRIVTKTPTRTSAATLRALLSTEDQRAYTEERLARPDVYVVQERDGPTGGWTDTKVVVLSVGRGAEETHGYPAPDPAVPETFGLLGYAYSPLEHHIHHSAASLLELTAEDDCVRLGDGASFPLLRLWPGYVPSPGDPNPIYTKVRWSGHDYFVRWKGSLATPTPDDRLRSAWLLFHCHGGRAVPGDPTVLMDLQMDQQLAGTLGRVGAVLTNTGENIFLASGDDEGCGMLLLPLLGEEGRHLRADTTERHALLRDHHWRACQRVLRVAVNPTEAFDDDIPPDDLYAAVRSLGLSDHELRAELEKLHRCVQRFGTYVRGRGRAADTALCDRLRHVFGSPAAAAEHLSTLSVCLRYLQSVGATGNHFVELVRDVHGCVWQVVHTGSRGLGSSLHKALRELAVAVGGNPLTVSDPVLRGWFGEFSESMATMAGINRFLCARATRRSMGCGMPSHDDLLHSMLDSRLLTDTLLPRMGADNYERFVRGSRSLAHGTTHNRFAVFVCHETRRTLVVTQKGAVFDPSPFLLHVVALSAGAGVVLVARFQPGSTWQPATMEEATRVESEHGYERVSSLGTRLSANGCPHGAGRCQSSWKTKMQHTGFEGVSACATIGPDAATDSVAGYNQPDVQFLLDSVTQVTGIQEQEAYDRFGFVVVGQLPTLANFKENTQVRGCIRGATAVLCTVARICHGLRWHDPPPIAPGGPRPVRRTQEQESVFRGRLARWRTAAAAAVAAHVRTTEAAAAVASRVFALSSGPVAGESPVDCTLRTWEELRQDGCYAKTFDDHGVRFVCEVSEAVYAYTRGAPLRTLLRYTTALGWSCNDTMNAVASILFPGLCASAGGNFCSPHPDLSRSWWASTVVGQDLPGL